MAIQVILFQDWCSSYTVYPSINILKCQKLHFLRVECQFLFYLEQFTQQKSKRFDSCSYWGKDAVRSKCSNTYQSSYTLHVSRTTHEAKWKHKSKRFIHVYITTSDSQIWGFEKYFFIPVNSISNSQVTFVLQLVYHCDCMKVKKFSINYC